LNTRSTCRLSLSLSAVLLLFVPSFRSFAIQAAPSNTDSSSPEVQAGIALFQHNDAVAAKMRFSTALRINPQSVDALTWRGIVENQLHQYREAEQDFTAALHIDPTRLPAHYNLALSLVRLGETNRAISELTEVVKANPGALEPEYNLAILLEQKHALNEAVEHLNAAHETRPDDISVIQHLLIDLDALGRRDEAQQLLNIFVSSTSVDILKATGVALLEAGDYSSAAVLLESVQQAAPSNRETNLLLARAYIGAQEDFKAVDLLKPEEAADRSGEAAYLLGLAYEGAGATEEASRAFERAIQANPGDGRAEYHLGTLALHDSDQLAAAVGHLKRAADLEPDNSAFAIAFGKALLEENHPKEALTILQRVRVEGPEAGERDLLLGISEITTNGPHLATPFLERAVAEDPSLALSHNILGFCYLTQGETDKAAISYGVASDLNPQSRLFAHGAAAAFDRANDQQHALMYAERAAALSDARAEDHYLLGKLFSKSGQPGNAIRELTQAVAIDPDDEASYYLLVHCYMQSGDSEQANAWVAKLKDLRKRQDHPGDAPQNSTNPISSSALLRGAPANESH
jgi:tetratricopeptide (TPR) repeat protein